MTSNLSSSAQKIQDTLDTLGIFFKVVELPSSTRSAQEAAVSIGCAVSQIGKSLIFKTINTARPILVIASGANQVDESKIGILCGEEIKRADAQYVRNVTGFAIGGIPPVGHTCSLETFIDEDLFQYPVVWAATGTPHGVFSLTPEELLTITAGKRSNTK